MTGINEEVLERLVRIIQNQGFSSHCWEAEEKHGAKMTQYLKVGWPKAFRFGER